MNPPSGKSDTETYLEALFGEGEGFVAVRFGREGGTERRYRWPDQRQELATDARREDATGRDVYVTPALRGGDKRRKGDAIGARWAWVDVDHALTADQAVVRDKLDGLEVLSGSPEARHLYVQLARAVDQRTHETLNRGLRDRLDGDAKWSDESLLRLPGTRNHKSDPARPVTVARTARRVWEPAELAKLLGVDLVSSRAEPTVKGSDAPDPEAAPDPLPELVVVALEKVAADYAEGRSGAHHALVGACRDAALSIGQAVTVAAGYAPSVEKYGGRVAEEVTRSWRALDAKSPTVLRRAERTAVGPLPTLPAEFWSARTSLAHIRRAAHARCVSADLVLHAVLCRLASQRHHETRVETGLGAAVLNLFSAVVGPSGAGKTSGVDVARELVVSPFSIEGGDAYRDGVPIGSGEGLAELFMGTREESTDEEYRGGPRKGEPKTRTVRSQTRHNAFVFVDEGEVLFRTTERKGATIAPTLRSAWTGGVLGQSNASAETTRVIPAGSYALGVVIGVQVDTVGPLFADAAGGTPQRFLFGSATDPAIPDDGPEWPGPLEGVAVIGTDQDRTMPLVDPAVRARLRSEHLGRHRGEVEDGDALDAHRPLHLAKVAALLAVLDGRREVIGDDWSLAEDVWSTSVAVRTALVQRGRELERERGEARTAAYVEREERAAVAREQSGGKVARIATRLALRVHDGHEATLPALNRRLAAKERGLFAAAIEHATGAGWLLTSGSSVIPGEVWPS